MGGFGGVTALGSRRSVLVLWTCRGVRDRAPGRPRSMTPGPLRIPTMLHRPMSRIRIPRRRLPVPRDAARPGSGRHLLRDGLRPDELGRQPADGSTSSRPRRSRPRILPTVLRRDVGGPRLRLGALSDLDDLLSAGRSSGPGGTSSGRIPRTRRPRVYARPRRTSRRRPAADDLRLGFEPLPTTYVSTSSLCRQPTSRGRPSPRRLM